MAGWDGDTGRSRVLRFPPLHKIKPMRNNQRTRGMDTTLGIKIHPDNLLARVDPGLRQQKHRAQLEVRYPQTVGQVSWGKPFRLHRFCPAGS